MKLVERDPRWVERNGDRIGFVFRSPTDDRWYQSCFVIPVPRSEQWALFGELFGEDFEVQACSPSASWRIDGGIEQASFDTLTVSPSIDGSAGGLWHGFIKNGLIVGGGVVS